MIQIKHYVSLLIIILTLSVSQAYEEDYNEEEINQNAESKTEQFKTFLFRCERIGVQDCSHDRNIEEINKLLSELNSEDHAVASQILASNIVTKEKFDVGFDKLNIPNQLKQQITEAERYTSRLPIENKKRLIQNPLQDFSSTKNKLIQKIIIKNADISKMNAHELLLLTSAIDENDSELSAAEILDSVLYPQKFDHTYSPSTVSLDLVKAVSSNEVMKNLFFCSTIEKMMRQAEDLSKSDFIAFEKSTSEFLAHYITVGQIKETVNCSDSADTMDFSFNLNIPLNLFFEKGIYRQSTVNYLRSLYTQTKKTHNLNPKDIEISREQLASLKEKCDFFILIKSVNSQYRIESFSTLEVQGSINKNQFTCAFTASYQNYNRIYKKTQDDLVRLRILLPEESYKITIPFNELIQELRN